MWSPDRRGFLALAGALALAGCGFRPALREEGATRELIGLVSFDLPPGRLGYAMREPLRRRLGPPGSDLQWLLVTDLALDETGLAITPDSSITRYVVRGRSRWRLEGPPDQEPLEGVAESMSAYSATGSLYATRAARRDAEERVARALGNEILVSIMAELAARRADG